MEFIASHSIGLPNNDRSRDFVRRLKACGFEARQLKRSVMDLRFVRGFKFDQIRESQSAKLTAGWVLSSHPRAEMERFLAFHGNWVSVLDLRPDDGRVATVQTHL